MNGIRTAALICYALESLISLGFGIVYLTRPKFMPYHEDAVGRSWEDLDPRLQALLLALMRSLGGGLIATRISVIIMLMILFRSQAIWPQYAIPVVALVSALSAFYSTLIVRRKTPASPPVGLALLSVVLIIAGLACSFL